MDYRTWIIAVLSILLILSFGLLLFLNRGEAPAQVATLPSPEGTPEDPTLVESRYSDEMGLLEITLYFLNQDYTQLVPEKRQIHQPGSIAERVQRGIEELIKGPRSSELRSTLPETTRLQTVFWSEREGRVYLSFSREFLDNKPTHALGEWAVLYSIVSTTVGLSPATGLSSAVKQVQILVDGEIIDSRSTLWDWSRPFEMNQAFLQYDLSQEPNTAG